MLRHEVVTTEKVPFTYRVAGVGSRFLGGLAGGLVCGGRGRVGGARFGGGPGGGGGGGGAALRVGGGGAGGGGGPGAPGGWPGGTGRRSRRFWPCACDAGSCAWRSGPGCSAPRRSSYRGDWTCRGGSTRAMRSSWCSWRGCWGSAGGASRPDRHAGT